MNAYLRKIAKEIGWNLCKINKHFLQFPFKRDYIHADCPTCDEIIYHKNLSNFFPSYLNTHLGNTLLVDNMPYRTYLNPPFNAIFLSPMRTCQKRIIISWRLFSCT
jgi:hypothetical protein